MNKSLQSNLADAETAQFPSISKLQNYVKDFQASKQKREFAEVETQIHSIMMDIEKEVIKECLSEFDIDAPAVSINNEVYKKVVRCDKDYQTAAGTLRVTRSLYRKSSTEKAICPLELQSGIIEGYWTPTAAEQGIYAISHITPLESEKMFKKIANMTPSKSSLDRLSKRLGKLWESSFNDNQSIIRLDEDLPNNAATVSLSLDGIMVPMSKFKDTDKVEIGSQYKESSCGTVSLYDKEGERISTVQIGRMPESKKTTLKSELKEEMDNLLLKNPNLNVVKIADGAKDNWNFLDKEIKQGTSILDFWHMSEHIKEAFDCAYKDDLSKSKAQFEKYKLILKQDKKGPEKLIRCLIHLSKRYPKRSVIARTLRYIRKNKKRMKYAEALENNFPIGSGIVEASCKTLVGERLKRSGMRWQQEGGQSVLSFRSLIKSFRFDKAWEIIALKYKGKVDIFKNITNSITKNKI